MFDVKDLASVAVRNDAETVRAEALGTDYLTTDVRAATLRVARVLLLRGAGWDHEEVDFLNKTDTLMERRIEALKAEGKKYRALIMANWATASQSDLSFYTLFLYNVRYRGSHAVLEHLLTGEGAAPPYLRLVMLNILRQSVGLSHDDLHRLSLAPFAELSPWVNRVFHDDAVFAWFARKKKSIRFYGGVTNTALGLYDELLASPEVGAEHLDRKAELRFDLGGGFNTSEIERLLGCTFVSADLMSPRLRDQDEELILLDRPDLNKPAVVADEATRARFLARQDEVEHLPFDVFKDSFPLHARSYSIVSAGFMTSNLRPTAAESREIKAARLGTLSTSVHAILRVMELVAAGKSVDLLTIQRASSRVFAYKTCLLQWREGKLVRLLTTDDPRAATWADSWDEVYRAISPDNPRYRALLD
jgi:hypothetical protein